MQSASAPEGTEIYALKEGQAPRKIWSGKDEVVYALAARPDGLLALTGNRGRVFRIQDDGNLRRCRPSGSAAGPGLAVEGKDRTFSSAPATPASCIRLGAQEKHEYASDVLDAGACARFGRIEVQPGSTGYELMTRSGNVEQPVRGWSDWEPLKDGAVASPAGRFLQWKAVLHPGGVLGGVGVNYLPVNSAPVVDDLVVVPGARLNPQNQADPPAADGEHQFPLAPTRVRRSRLTGQPNAIRSTAFKDRTAITARWAAHDDNGDDLTFSLYSAGDNEKRVAAAEGQHYR